MALARATPVDGWRLDDSQEPLRATTCRPCPQPKEVRHECSALFTRGRGAASGVVAPVGIAWTNASSDADVEAAFAQGLRLLLKALAAANTKDADRADAVSRERVLKLFADPVATRPHADVLNNCAEAIAGALAEPRARPNGRAHDAGLRHVAAHAPGRRLTVARRPAHGLAGAGAAGEGTRRRAERCAAGPPGRGPRSGHDGRSLTDGYERQAILTTAAYLLREAGRSDTALALRWSEDVFHAAQGAATRLQWGATHVADLVELAAR